LFRHFASRDRHVDVDISMVRVTHRRVQDVLGRGRQTTSGWRNPVICGEAERTPGHSGREMAICGRKASIPADAGMVSETLAPAIINRFYR
jgi:hypothetical protein